MTAADPPALQPSRDARVDLTTKGFPTVDGSISLAEVGGQGWTLDRSRAPRAAAPGDGARPQHRADGGVLLDPRRGAGAAREDDDGAAALAAPARRRRVGHQRRDRRPRPGDARRRRATGADRQRGDRSAGCEMDRRSHCAIPASRSSAPSIPLARWSCWRRGSSRRPRPLPVLVELGHPGGRTGCRSVEDAIEVARLVKTGAPTRPRRRDGLRRDPLQRPGAGVPRRGPRVPRPPLFADGPAPIRRPRGESRSRG